MNNDTSEDNAPAGERPTMSQPETQRPETIEFYSEIHHGESVIEMPASDDVTSHSVDIEAAEVGPVDGRANSKAFEEEMDDL